MGDPPSTKVEGGKASGKRKDKASVISAHRAVLESQWQTVTHAVCCEVLAVLVLWRRGCDEPLKVTSGHWLAKN